MNGAGFWLASDSDKLSQAQTWPGPGGHTGDHACRSTVKALPTSTGLEAL